MKKLNNQIATFILATSLLPSATFAAFMPVTINGVTHYNDTYIPTQNSRMILNNISVQEQAAIQAKIQSKILNEKANQKSFIPTAVKYAGPVMPSVPTPTVTPVAPSIPALYAGPVMPPTVQVQPVAPSIPALYAGPIAQPIIQTVTETQTISVPAALYAGPVQSPKL